ncbi:MAG: M28 family peptidase [Chloroflexota bacterium]
MLHRRLAHVGVRSMMVAVFLVALALVACTEAGDDGATRVTENAPVVAPTVGVTATASATAAASPTPTMTAVASATIEATEVAPTEEPAPTGDDGVEFSGERAFDQLEAQMAFGPRWPGSPGHEAVGDYIVEELRALGWEVEEQQFEYMGVEGRNIIGRANMTREDVYIIGAHYDTRRVADETPGAVEEQLPVPGAVDGASGVALLLELARTLDLEEVPGAVWLTFFDMEDNGSGGIPGWDWIVGSTHMAENLEVTPEAMVLVDMIGDADQQLFFEGNSDAALRESLWSIAGDLGYGDTFIPRLRYTIIDDHVPFARRGIPAVDIIDFDYPYWHTVEDTTDKASAESLERVGRTIEVWLESELE